MEITSLEQLKQISGGDIVELPSFKEGVPFVARVKRASLLNLVQKGVVPNQLLSAAESIFYGKQSSTSKIDMSQMAKVMVIMAENTLIEPTADQIKEAGLEMTDEQLVDLFNYSQQGVKGLKSFRAKQQDNERDSNSESVPSETQPDNQSNK